VVLQEHLPISGIGYREYGVGCPIFLVDIEGQNITSPQLFFQEYAQLDVVNAGRNLILRSALLARVLAAAPGRFASR
jgi:hypothetical protein